MRAFKTVCSVAVLSGVAACGPQTAERRDAPEPEATGVELSRPQGIFELPYLQQELDNGLRIIIVPTGFPGIVTVQIPVQTGSRNEVEPGKSGFAHFFEHMMFRGTERFPAQEYQEILRNAGADQNAYTTDDFTNYHTTVTRADLTAVLELEADRFQNLKYSEEDFRTEALAVRGEYLKNFSNPALKIYETLRGLHFRKHTYRHTTIGFFEDIEDMPNQLEYSKTFFDRWYRPEKSAVIVVGDVDPQQTLQWIEQYWGGWGRGDYDVSIPVEPPPRGPQYEHIQWDAPTQAQLVIAFRGPAFDPAQEELPALTLLGEIYLSDSSDLYQRVVNQEQWADSLSYWFPDRKDPHLLIISARLNAPEHAHKAAEAILQTLARARTEQVSTDRLNAVKSHLRYSFVATLDNSESIGATLARFAHYARDPVRTINTLYETIRSVTPEDLQRVASVYFTDAGRTVVSLSDGPELPELDALPQVDALVEEQQAREPQALPVVERPVASPLVDVSLVFGSGAAHDPEGKKGLALLTAQMIVDGGSQARSIRELVEARHPMAAPFTAQVDKEMTVLRGTVHRDNVDRWHRLAMEQLVTPGWREDDFERIRRRLINAITTDLRANNDEELGKEVLYARLFGPDHPFGFFNGGAVTDLERITLEDVKQFYVQHYTTSNLVLGVAGGYEGAFLSSVRNDLGRLPHGGRQTMAPPQPPPLRGRHATLVEKETQSVAVSFGFPISVKRGDRDWVALWLARSWLGEHRSANGQLFQRIREARGLNYGSYAYIEYFPRGMFQFHPDPNLARGQQIFQVWIRPLTDNNAAHFATRAALYELQRMIEDGLSSEEFESTRNYLGKYVAQLLKTQSRQLGYELDSRYYGIEPFAEYLRRELRELTLEDVNAAIRRHLQTEKVHFVFVTRDAQDLRRRLVDDVTSPITYNTDMPEGLLAEDRVIQALPIDVSADRVTVLPVEQVFR